MRRLTGLGILALCLLAQLTAWAHATGVTLSGAITGPNGAPVAGAKVSVKSSSSGTSTEAQTDASGRYSVPSLAPGAYGVSVSADGFSAKQQNLTIAAGPRQSLDLALTTAPGTGAPSLGDLGFPTNQTQGNAQNQALLDRRSHMLMIHQRLGLITAAPLLATLLLSGGAGGKSASSTVRDLHATLGSVTVGMYLWTASYAIRAPRIAGTPTRGPIRVHKALAWVHGTGMILTPILGAMAFDQKSKGERVHGIASAHGAVGAITGIAYGAAIVSVSFKF